MAYCIYHYEILESIKICMEHRRRKRRKFLGITFL